MPVEIRVPALPESVADAVIAGWHKQEGDTVNQDENLVDLETDKVILEVPAVSNGVLKEIRFNVGDTVTADQVIAVIDDSATAGKTGQDSSTTPEAILQVDDAEEQELSMSADIAISPSARKLMAENRISPVDIKGSGKRGRILKEDVVDYLAGGSQSAAVEQQAVETAVHEHRAEQAPRVEALSVEGRIERRVPMTRLRARIAERLLEAQHN
ncbi:MAG: E3 binding domain-containing protein, partial [Gammaproteobacteria bacterium]